MYSLGHNENPDDKKSFNSTAKSIAQNDRQHLADSLIKDRQQAYKNVYKTNIAWGGGSKEHPGKRRDTRGYTVENDNYKLSQ